MKTQLLALFVALLTFSCQEEKIVEVPVPQETLTGTTWTRLDHVDRGTKVYEVVEFTKDTVRVNYKHNKKDIYVAVGNYEYMYDPERKQFWTKNPDNSLIWGDIDGDRMFLGGKELIKEK